MTSFYLNKYINFKIPFYYIFHFLLEMHFVPAYMDNLTKGQRTYVNKRTQKYSRQTQYYAHTFNPKPAHGLPFFVKIPEHFEVFRRST